MKTVLHFIIGTACLVLSPIIIVGLMVWVLARIATELGGMLISGIKTRWE